MILSGLIVLWSAVLVDSTVSMPVGQFRRALTIIVDDSICNEQVRLLDRVVQTQDSAYRELSKALADATRAQEVTSQALDTSNAGRAQALKVAGQITRESSLWRYATYVSTTAAGMLGIAVLVLSLH